MSKNPYTSELLKPKAISVMIGTNSKFKEKVERYEKLNTKNNLNLDEKREKVILKDFIHLEIQSYKKIVTLGF